MPEHRRTRSSRISEAMKRCGVVRTVGVAFGRVRTAPSGTPIFSLVGQFIGGDAIAYIAEEFDLTPEQVTNAIRFTLIYPQCEQESFWRGLPDQMPEEIANG